MVKKKVEVAEHVLLLKHEKLDEKSTEELLIKYNISKRQLPRIHKKDPGLRNLPDVNPGDIIQISRSSPTMGKIKFYRVVISG